MSFSGGSTKAMPAPKQKPLGLDESRASTNEQARPVPYLAGKTRVGVTWLTDAFDVTATPVTQSAGKGRTTTVGYNYRASLAALVCHGPVDRLHKIYLNGDEVWTGDFGATAADFDPITIEDYGVMRLYWGRADQEMDSLLIGTGIDHPPYQGQCYVVFNSLFFGFNQTSAPNVELVISRHPKPSWFGALSAQIDGDCNPVAIITEWLTNRSFGLGWSEARLDTTALLAVAGQLATEGIGLSPFITKQTSARQLITQMCEYFDGYAQMTPEGKFKLGLIRPAADVNALPLIDENVLCEEPELNPESWRGIKTKTWIKFTDRNRAYKENALPYRDPGAATITSENSPQTIERPWVTGPALAQKIVAAEGRAAALPATSGELKVRKSVTLHPGDLFRLSYAHLGISNMVMRVTSRSPGRPGSRTINLQVALDRSYLNDAYYIPPDDAVPEAVDTTPKPFDHVKLIELPRGLDDGGKITVAPMAVRPNRFTTGYDIHLRRAYTITTSYNYRNYYTGIYWTGQYAYNSAGSMQADVVQSQIIDESFKLRAYCQPAAEAALIQAARDLKLIIQLVPYTNYRSTFVEQMGVLDWVPTGNTVGGLKEARISAVRARQGSGMYNIPTHPLIFTPAQYYINNQPLFQLAYDKVDNHESFAIRGTLVEDYPADTALLDHYQGMLVNFGTTTNPPNGPSWNNAMEDELLLFAGDEILSVAEIVPVETGYRVTGIRGRFDTRATALAAGTELYFIARQRLKKMTHATFKQYVRCNLKLQPTVLRKTLDMAQASTVGLSLTGRVNCPLGVINLRAFGEGRNPTYTTGEHIELSWNLCEHSPRDFWGRWGNPAESKTATVLELFNHLGVLKATITTPPGATTYDLQYYYDSLNPTRPYINTHFTSHIKVRATALENGLKSRFYEELTIRKI